MKLSEVFVEGPSDEQFREIQTLDWVKSEEY
jgi:hypothetical protein